MNLFYSLPDEVQHHILRLSEKTKYDEVVRSIPEHSTFFKEIWISMRNQERVIAEIKSMSSFIKMSSFVMHVGNQYLLKLVDNQDHLENITTFDYFINFIQSILSEKSHEYCYNIEHNMIVNHTVHTHTLELLWQMQYDAFCSNY
jgi:hypothetical protein